MSNSIASKLNLSRSFVVKYYTQVVQMGILERITTARKAKGITQTFIAEKLEMDRGNYSKLEKRGEKMTVEQLQSIADALEVSVPELLGMEVKAETGQPEKVETLEIENSDLKRINDGYKLLYTESLNKLQRLYSTLIRHIQSNIIQTALLKRILSEERCEGWLVVEFNKDEPPVFLYVDAVSVEAKNLKPDSFLLSHFMTEAEIFECLSNRDNEKIIDDLQILNGYGLIEDKNLERAFTTLQRKRAHKHQFEDSKDRPF